jgi:flavin-binding protein dodecin
MATRVIEVMATSKRNWEGPVLNAAEDADESLRNIKAVWIKSLHPDLASGKIKSWTLTCTVNFELDEEDHNGQKNNGASQHYSGIKRVFSFL